MPDDEEYCANCGYAKYDEDGNETHLDEDEYDHDFESEEESTTLEDINNLLDTANKGLDFYNKIKKQSEPSRLELNPNKFNTTSPQPESFFRKSLDPLDAKEDKRHKETIKWTKIGIFAGAIVATILGVTAIIFG